MNKVRHVLGISGGKDSTALAVYLKNKYPQLDIDYYFCDTGMELPETYKLLDNLKNFLGKEITLLKAAPKSPKEPFDHFIELYGGFLPSSSMRWCTAKLKLEPFEEFVGNDLVISYVGIRGDEEREGYISKKENIQSIFPFRKNIWSQDIVEKVLKNENIELITEFYKNISDGKNLKNVLEIVKQPLSFRFPENVKLKALLDIDTTNFNKVVFSFIKQTKYPLSFVDEYPLVENEEVLGLNEILKLLETSNIGVPEYYNKKEFVVNGQKGVYNRSRSGCFFCFFQQKIEWVWLYENHRDLYIKAMEYEKEGYNWMQGESLAELIKPERIEHIKKEQLKKLTKNSSIKSKYLLDILDDDERSACTACSV
ncbi:phosphoadenosine phosphosulfate reductase family protein [Flavobacterium filum]|uniref:phosphoadenosine phosphosulfate reductase family protein n=1 Tax=Flavobacterium filum TaxID=370974 RepID=UPI0023EFF6C1|nr:phosphoadenosine phosphosulfate reductase family protein [Flavobacterium filum]